MISPPQDGAASGEPKAIRLRGVRQNNLKNIDCDIPLNQLTVITGVSGSGKSSLAFDTLYAEGQRRYVETFSSYTRQFLERLQRPDVDSVEGIPPAVAIDPSGAVKTSRSTVGTMTGLNDYLKLLFSRTADGFCPECDKPVQPEGTRAVVEYLLGHSKETFPALIVAPLALGSFESVDMIRGALLGQGILRYMTGEGDVRRVEDLRAADVKAPTLQVVVDRLNRRPARSRLADGADQGFRLGAGMLEVHSQEGRRRFTQGLRCGDCGVPLPNPSPGLFSFNNPYGACSECRGFGKVIDIDWDLVVPDPRLSLSAGAIKPWATKSRARHRRRALQECERRGIPLDVPFGELPVAQQQLVLEGERGFGGVRGFFRKLEQKKYKMHVRVFLARYRGYETCGACGGGRLRREALCFRVQGKTLPEMWDLSVRELLPSFEDLEHASLPRHTLLVVEEITSRLRYLQSVGLGYLTLGRQSRTLSGGEVERVNLTAALGACLVNTLFVLDEPSIGLHARDNARLLGILAEVRDRQNTVVVVEHDPEIIQAADHLIDIGPGSGEHGGEIIASGPVAEVKRNKRSLTGDYLSGRRRLQRREHVREIDSSRCLRIQGAHANNLRDLDIALPLDAFVVISGVSGSGKSTLLEDVLWRAYGRSRGQSVGGNVEAQRITGLDLIDEIVLVDQSPIGRTPRGNPVTYTKLFDPIRALFAATPDAQAAGLGASHFSFNVDLGRCPECSGAGAMQVEMQFLSDVTLTCESCGGKRFRDEVLEVRLRGKNIHEVLGLTLREAAEFFAEHKKLVDGLEFLDALGLGYLTLGQPINTLSGGEAQRLKLAGRVMAASRQRLLFLLDEPTTGLHLNDVKKLLEVIHDLVDRGHSVIVIEHHLDVIADADYVVDLGPEGGDGGGQLVDAGTPVHLAENAANSGSLTGLWLRRMLEESEKKRPRASAARRETVRPSGNGKGNGNGNGSGNGGNGNGNDIRVVGARENNLQDITASLPRDELVVVTGLSGAGKSSLLYDIVFAEGQRRYLDCLSPYARQFVEDLHRPDIDHLEGIPPTVAIEQRTTVGGRKSTVGTITEIYQFLRLLFARIGVQYCPQCEVEVIPRTRDNVHAEVRKLARRGGRLLAPVVRGKKGFHNRLLARARKGGILDARIDGEWVALPEDREIRLERHRTHEIDLMVRKFAPGNVALGEVKDSVATALEWGNGVAQFLADDGSETLFNLRRTCPSCSRDFEEPDPRNFSFHSRHGACATCGGYGSRWELDPERLLSRWDLPVSDRKRGPLAFLDDPPFTATAKNRLWKATRGFANGSAKPNGRSHLLDTPLAAWPKRELQRFLWGDARGGFDGVMAAVAAFLDRLDEEDRDRHTAHWGKLSPCSTCDGGRLQTDWLQVKFQGASIADLSRQSIAELQDFFARARLPAARRAVGEPIVNEIRSRLDFLLNVGVEYLTLDRAAATLSTGEAQRIRLASQLGSRLRGACYILDEPTIGLHPRDNDRLLRTLRDLRDRGNSVLVIEHDDATMEAADTVVDMGPGPGRHGGKIVVQGALSEIVACGESATGAYFRQRRERTIELRSCVRADTPGITVKAAYANNLRDIDARFPAGALTVVTGVSGAGKSTLVRDVLEESVRRQLRGLRVAAAGCRAIEGADSLVAVREVDQLPIGRTPRSTPATYIGLWDRIRAIFASTPEARARGYQKRRFSFNVADGRCDTCGGQGRIRMEMNFLPDVTIDCEVCDGRRFNAETLEVVYHGKNIADILEMPIEEAREFFDAYPEISRSLTALDDLGLGYLTLGQASTTLSGGEAQRVKLGVELVKATSGTCLYLLDEPTTGLHMLDVERLVAILRRLAEAGHIVVVIEHHLEIIAGADWVIDLGPDGGEGGGDVVYQGAPKGLLRRTRRSPTARSLKGWLEGIRESRTRAGN